jgi:hypothetical protein
VSRAQAAVRRQVSTNYQGMGVVGFSKATSSYWSLSMYGEVDRQMNRQKKSILITVYQEDEVSLTNDLSSGKSLWLVSEFIVTILKTVIIY